VKPPALQWLWMGAAALLFAGMALDIAGVIAPPSLLWLGASILMMAAGWFVMPSMAELRRTNRRA